MGTYHLQMVSFSLQRLIRNMAGVNIWVPAWTAMSDVRSTWLCTLTHDEP